MAKEKENVLNRTNNFVIFVLSTYFRKDFFSLHSYISFSLFAVILP